MFFRRRRAPDPRTAAWSAVAGRLGLLPLDGDERDAVLAGLAVEGRADFLHAWRREGLPTILLFDHAPPRAGGRGLAPPRLRAVLEATEARAGPSWRALTASRPLLAELEAGRTGGAAVATGDAAFDARIALIAREPEAVAARLDPRVREALARLLAEEGMPEATVTSGERHLAWRAHGDVDRASEAFEAVLARLLVLWLAAGGEAPAA